ncbi:MAG: LamG-like jellyroll fold domain-containing protein [Bacteroidota bacterium]
MKKTLKKKPEANSVLKQTIFCVLLLTGSGNNFAGAQVVLPELVNSIATSAQDIRNINHPDGVLFQHAKRAVVQIFFRYSDAYYSVYSGVMVNNTSQGRQPLILTAAHTLRGFLADATQVTGYLTANYEMGDAIERGSPNNRTDAKLTQTFPFKAAILFSDNKSDIALLQITHIDMKSMDNVYMAGWKLQKTKGGILGSVSHPSGDFKKVLYNPAKVDFGYKKLWVLHDGEAARTGPGFFFECIDPWNGVGTALEIGSGGCPLFNSQGNIVGIAISSGDYVSAFSGIQNAWYNSDPLKKGLADFLDPSGSLINEVPGGYLADLLPVRSDISLSLNSGERKTIFDEIKIDYSKEDFFNLSNLINPGLGLKMGSNPQQAKVFLTVKANVAGTEYLLYGVYSNAQNTSPAVSFEGTAWNIYNPPLEFPSGIIPVPTGSISEAVSYSTDFKKNLINSFREILKKNVLGFKKSGEISIPIKIELFRMNDGYPGSAEVKALNIPVLPPINALELFKPAEVSSYFKSRKYLSSMGHSSENLFINSVKVDQVILKNQIATGNNGGYLNLVNPNYLIETIKTSYMSALSFQENKIKFSIGVSNKDPLKSFYYKIWMDFFPETDDDNYYNFVSDREPHLEEELASGSGTSSIEREVTMPDNVTLKMKPGDTKTCRMRIAISYDNEIQQDGKYEDGEVEDYLVKVRVPADAEVLASFATLYIPVRAGDQHGTEDNECGVPAEEPPSAPAGTAVNVGDATHPYSCNSYVCASSTCAANAANSTTPLMGEYSVCISGTADYIALDEGDQFIHKAFSNRTVSFWLNNTDDPGIEEVYDEGGSTEGGLGIRINNTTGKMELAVRKGTSSKMISAAIPSTNWLHVVAIFENGKLSLYQNGTLAAANDAVGFTSVPAHNDGAGFGGTNGTNVFGSVNKSYHGCADEILIFDKALNATQVDVLYQAGLGGGSHALAKPEEPQNNINVMTNVPKPGAALIIYPNPSGGNINLITEVKAAGPLIIQITDLQGRLMYEKNISGVSVGFQQVSLSNLRLKASTYIVKVASRGNVQTGKLVVEN